MITTETIYERQATQLAAIVGAARAARRVCPMVAAGLHCRATARYADTGELCACQRFSHLLDHGRAWRCPAGHVIITGEPYDADGSELAALAAFCDAHGLDMIVSGRSTWNPGDTFLIIVRRQDCDKWRCGP